MIIAPHDSINSIKSVEMEEVVVSSQRAPVTFSQVARILTIIEKDEIQHAPVQNLQDLLEYSAGVDIRQRGGPGVQSDVSIRGSSFDQVLILLNGVSINDPQTGHHNLNIPLPLDGIERIEILEGPASRVYGLNAFGGAINIITSKEKLPNIKSSLSYGEHDFFNGELSGNLIFGRVNNFFSGEYNSSDGYIKNTDYKVSNAFYNGRLATHTGEFQLQAGYCSKAFGSNSFYTPVYPDQFENTGTAFTSLKMESHGKIHFSPAIYWRRNQDRFELFRYPDKAPSWYKAPNYHLTDVYGTMINSWFSSCFGKTALGVEFRSENILSNVLGKPLFKPVPIPGEKGHEFTFYANRNNFSLYAEHSVYFDRLNISGGMMANFNTQTGNHLNLYPGIDLSWDVLKCLKFYSSVNKSLRIPTFTDLYYSSPTNTGNPSLKPEEAVAVESGLKYNNQWLSAHVLYFHRWGNNLIDWVQKSGETIWKAENLTDLNTDGIEVSINLIPGKILKNKSLIKSIKFSYSWLDQGKESGFYSSQYVMDYLKNKIVLGITHSFSKRVGADWTFSYQDRNGKYTKWEGSTYGKEVSYPHLFLADARIFWQNKVGIIYLESSNLFDQNQMDYSNVMQPGRWIKFGIKAQIGS
jgi:iron complex outermembrane receptor protein